MVSVSSAVSDGAIAAAQIAGAFELGAPRRPLTDPVRDEGEHRLLRPKAGISLARWNDGGGHAMAGSNSVVVLLKRDHQKVGQMLSEFDALELDALGGYFRRLEEELVRHEIAEELVVYPAFRKEVPRSDSIADACLAEQTEAEIALAKLEREDTATESFRNQLEELREAVLAHAKHEEREVFPSLETYDAADLQSLGERYERALAAASPVDGAGEDARGGSTSDLADRIRAAMSHAD